MPKSNSNQPKGNELDCCNSMDWTHAIDDWDTPVNYCANCGAVSYD